MPKAKRCSTCLEIKALDDFYKKLGTPTGRSYQCKPCVIKAVRRSQAKNASQLMPGRGRPRKALPVRASR